MSIKKPNSNLHLPPASVKAVAQLFNQPTLSQTTFATLPLGFNSNSTSVQYPYHSVLNSARRLAVPNNNPISTAAFEGGVQSNFIPQPQVFSFFDVLNPSDLENTISVLTLVVFFKYASEEALPVDQFTGYFDFSFNKRGGLQLNCMIQIPDHPSAQQGSSQSKPYFDYNLQLGLRYVPDSLATADMPATPELINLTGLDTVQVTLVNLDPETSRGTETTVQPGVGN